MLAFLLLIPDEQNRKKAEKIYWDYHEDMIRYARSRLRKYNMPDCTHNAEDVTQSSFLRIMENIDNFDLDAPRKETRAYIFTIISNEAKKIVSNYVYWEELDDCCDLIDKEKFFEELRIKEQYERVVEVIEDMPDIYSLTLMMYYCDEKTVKQIADFMDISEKTVYTRLRRGRTMLINQLKEKGF